MALKVVYPLENGPCSHNRCETAHEYKPIVLHMYSHLRDLELRSNAKGRTLLFGNPDTLQDALEVPLDGHQLVISCGGRCYACLKV